MVWPMPVSDHVPVLAITGQVSRKDIGTNVKQYIEQQSLLSPLVSLYQSNNRPSRGFSSNGKGFAKGHS